MSPAQALILGLVQGLTEFLPVSSSGHLVIAQTALGITTPPVFFDVLIHVASLFAVIIFFFPRLRLINKHLFLLLSLATVPAAAAGFFLEPIIHKLFSSLVAVAVGLLITSILLFASHFFASKRHTLKTLPPNLVLLIGLFQALAIVPGISRSGSTISAATLVGLNRKDAFFFSFLIAIPVIIGAFILQLTDLSTVTTPPFSLAVGFAASLTSGLVALKILDRLISSSRFYLFGFYTLALSVILLFQFI